MSPKKKSSKKRDILVYRRALVMVFFISIAIMFFFLYDIVLLAMDDEPVEEEKPQNVISVIEPEELPEREPESIVVSDKIVFLAHLSVDGKDYTFPFRTYENATVQDLLEKAGITLSENDIINYYERDTKLFEDIYVEIGRIEYKYETTTVEIPYETEECQMIYSIWAKSQYGSNVPGQNGTKEITTRVKYVNGKAVSSTVTSEKVIKKPVTAKVYVDKTSLLDLRSGPPSKYLAVIDVRCTAYTYAEKGGKVTYSGEKTKVGYVAVDKDVIPIYSELYIVLDNGFVYGYCKAMDTGGGIKGNKIDLFLPDYTDMQNFGVKTGKAYIITYGNES